MKKHRIKIDKKLSLNYMTSNIDSTKPWIVLIMPFGLKLSMSEPFFEFFESHYNVVTWESRFVLDDSNHEPTSDQYSVAYHVQDLLSVMDDCEIKDGILVGYCSGAGIALAAGNRAPHRFSRMVLVHGEFTMLDSIECMTQFSGDVDSLLTMAASDSDVATTVFEKIRDERMVGGSDIPDGIDMPYSDVRFFRRYANNYLSYKSENYLSLADMISHDTFILTGRKDIQANVESATAIRERIPHAKIHIDPEANHYGMVKPNSNTMVTIWNDLLRG